jgi:hypothetical protein
MRKPFHYVNSEVYRFWTLCIAALGPRHEFAWDIRSQFALRLFICRQHYVDLASSSEIRT